MVSVRLLEGDKTYEELAKINIRKHLVHEIHFFKNIQGYFNSNKNPKTTLISSTPDDSYMIGRHWGLIAYFKSFNTKMFKTYCIKLWQHLVEAGTKLFTRISRMNYF